MAFVPKRSLPRCRCGRVVTLTLECLLASSLASGCLGHSTSQVRMVTAPQKSKTFRTVVRVNPGMWCWWMRGERDEGKLERLCVRQFLEGWSSGDASALTTKPKPKYVSTDCPEFHRFPQRAIFCGISASPQSETDGGIPRFLASVIGTLMAYFVSLREA